MPRTGLAVFLVALVLPLGLADAGSKPVIFAPASAALGSTIKVTTSKLKPDTYALRLYSTKAPDPGTTCVAVLKRASKTKITHLTANVKLPAKLQCFSGFPASHTGSVAATPGTYSLIVSVPQAISTTAAHGNVVIRKIKLR